MKIFIICPVYPPEPVISAITSYQIAEELSKKSHEVTVITSFPSRPGGRLYDGYKRSFCKTENHLSGIKVIRVFSFISKKSTLFSRFMENISFAISSTICLLFKKKPTIIYLNTWPLFSQGLVSFVGKMLNIPVVLSIQDVYPESLIFQRRISHRNILIKILNIIDKKISTAASKIIVISKQFAEIYIKEKNIDRGKIEVVPNWVDTDSIALLPKTQYRKKKNIPLSKFVFVYAGNIGVASGIEDVITAFGQTKNKNILFLIAGEGSQLNFCIDLVKRLELKNIIFHTPWLNNELSEVLSAADVLILPTQGKQSLVSVPSKILNYMLSARPIFAIASRGSETAEIIQKADCGWVITDNEINTLVRKIYEISKLSSDELVSLGKSGRQYVINNYSKQKILPRIVDLLETYEEKD